MKLKFKENTDLDIDWNAVPAYNQMFAKELFNCINSFLDKDNINESFSSKKSLKYHFIKHCLAGKDKKSTKTNVYYDFNALNEYREYEKLIIKGLDSEKLIVIDSLGDPEEIADKFQEFFKGDSYMLFSPLCGFNNKGKSISILLKSFSTDATKNYINNSISFDILSKRTTHTLYPIDSHYLEQKLNNIIKNQLNKEITLNINH